MFLFLIYFYSRVLLPVLPAGLSVRGPELELESCELYVGAGN